MHANICSRYARLAPRRALLLRTRSTRSAPAEATNPTRGSSRLPVVNPAATRLSLATLDGATVAATSSSRTCAPRSPVCTSCRTVPCRFVITRPHPVGALVYLSSLLWPMIGSAAVSGPHAYFSGMCMPNRPGLRPARRGNRGGCSCLPTLPRSILSVSEGVSDSQMVLQLAACPSGPSWWDTASATGLRLITKYST
jgi:hypothetical protein